MAPIQFLEGRHRRPSETIHEALKSYAVNSNDIQLQTKGVYAALQGGAYSPQALGERVVKVVKEFAVGCDQHDDIALLTFGRTA